MKYLSQAFKDLRARTVSDYSDGNWAAGRRWRSRVGLPRLVAEVAASEASGILHGINLGMHRTEPELDELLCLAREATNAYAVAVSRSNWEKFER